MISVFFNGLKPRILGLAPRSGENSWFKTKNLWFWVIFYGFRVFFMVFGKSLWFSPNLKKTLSPTIWKNLEDLIRSNGVSLYKMFKPLKSCGEICVIFFTTQKSLIF